MDPGILALMIPILGMSIPIIAIWSKHQHRMAELRLDSAATQTAEKAAQYASHVAELEQRVRVLERIVTDQGYDTARQIEALRDVRAVADRASAIELDNSKKERV